MEQLLNALAEETATVTKDHSGNIIPVRGTSIALSDIWEGDFFALLAHRGHIRLIFPVANELEVSLAPGP